MFAGFNKIPPIKLSGVLAFICPADTSEQSVFKAELRVRTLVPQDAVTVPLGRIQEHGDVVEQGHT